MYLSLKYLTHLDNEQYQRENIWPDKLLRIQNSPFQLICSRKRNQSHNETTLKLQNTNNLLFLLPRLRALLPPCGSSHEKGKTREKIGLFSHVSPSRSATTGPRETCRRLRQLR